jgi:hypothetical protein
MKFGNGIATLGIWASLAVTAVFLPDPLVVIVVAICAAIATGSIWKEQCPCMTQYDDEEDEDEE